MEWFAKERPSSRVSAVLFDFDGTISTLRCGWEGVMEPLMAEMIAGGGEPDQEIVRLVRGYIDESTGIQTIFQMRWLADTVREYGLNPHPLDGPWAYKAEYNRRLMLSVAERRERVASGREPRENYLIRGSEDCLRMLSAAGVALYVASGTDDEDVKREVDVLGLAKYFTRVTGAPAGRADCSKERIVRELIGDGGVRGDALAVVGDGKVEIAIGRERGARTLGIASDERLREGVNPVKRRRLVNAGADAVAGDFTETDMLELFFLGGRVS